MDYKKVYEEWLANPYFDEATRKNCEQLRETKKKSKNAFMRIWSLVLLV